MRIPALLRHARDPFPDPGLALTEPNGLLAIGGELSTKRLLNAYHAGIFPWYEADQPILWWSPDPRAILPCSDLQISHSLRKTLKRNDYRVSADTAFSDVMRACAAPRAKQDGTWITPEMQHAYYELHQQGHAHSIEVWRHDELIGGVYGIAVGRIFCGESMFSRQRDGSKIALVYLCHLLIEHGYDFIDCQVMNPHLASLGSYAIPRHEYLTHIQQGLLNPVPSHPWVITWRYS